MSSNTSPQAIICPSLLSGDFAMLAQEANRMVSDGADWLHMDIMDGHFVDNLTIGPPVIKSLRQHTKAFLDCHLMVSDPGKWIEDFCNFGADQVTFHIETQKSTDDAIALVKKIHTLGKKCGISVKPKTDIKVLYPILDSVKLDNVLVMTVEPGFGGQEFMADQMPKVETLRKKYPNINIQVDGGINGETVEVAAKAGANVIVSGSGIFKAKSPSEMISHMRDVVQQNLK